MKLVFFFFCRFCSFEGANENVWHVLVGSITSVVIFLLSVVVVVIILIKCILNLS